MAKRTYAVKVGQKLGAEGLSVNIIPAAVSQADLSLGDVIVQIDMTKVMTRTQLARVFEALLLQANGDSSLTP